MRKSQFFGKICVNPNFFVEINKVTRYNITNINVKFN
jgi:hypothetical protein